jgi:hypothetical protein
MSHSFTAYRYIRTPAGESVLDVAEVPINLASPHIEAPARGTLLLTGGFTSIMADDAIPVSATLQLNGDLAGHDPEVLRAIALPNSDATPEVHGGQPPMRRIAGSPLSPVMFPVCKNLSTDMEAFSTLSRFC